MLQQPQNLGRRIGTSKMYLSSPCFGSCPFKGGGSVVVDSMLIVIPIMGFCNVSMLCVTLCPFLFCNHLDGEEIAIRMVARNI